ncbi:MAG: site-specific integrase, partial [Flavobacteriales bacterium]|nr:site-specific integrase [Flavobacteriales bacterium]
MKAKINVLFYLRKSKVNAVGRMPIFQRITVNGQRFDISTGHYVEEQKWSSEISRMKGNSEEAHTINSQLELFKAKV